MARELNKDGGEAGNPSKRVVDFETQAHPTDPALGGVNPQFSPWDYGLGNDMTHEQVSKENPVVWPLDNGNIG